MLGLDGSSETDVYRLLARQFYGTTLRYLERDGVALSVNRYPARVCQPWHTHENATFFVHIRGPFVDRSWTSEAVMEPLSVAYHPTDEPHQSQAVDGEAYGFNVEIPAAWLWRHGTTASDLGRYAVLDGPGPRLASLRLLCHAFSPKESMNQLVENDILALMDELRSSRRSLADKPAPQWLPAVEDYLLRSLDEATGLRDAARAACVHPVYLARVFRSHYGCSVGEFIRKNRILRAASHALQTDCNLAEAAHEARFADQSHFTRLFTRETGVSPKVLLRIRGSS